MGFLHRQIAEVANLPSHSGCSKQVVLKMNHAFQRWLKVGILAVLGSALSVGLWIGLGATPATAEVLISRLPAGNAITDGKALLQYALPIDNKPVRKLQETIEEMSSSLRNRKRLSGVTTNLAQAERVLTARKADLLASISSDRQPQAEQLIAQLSTDIADMRAALEAEDREAIWIKRREMLDQIGELEALMVQGFPFEVPEEYSNLPQLKGRATIAIQTSKGDVTVVVDGYSAPVTAGNFVDLVQRKFYDGLEFTRAEESYVLQIGDPPGPEVGFIDPQTKKYRAIPLEILVQGDKEPTYGITLEDAGRFREQPVLPFAAYGALALARPSDDVNGGSSQFFFFLFERELTPPGANLLDGRYAIFGFVTEGQEVLGKLKEGDRIESAKVIQGAENLVA
jgi:peptidylprolyl isomerase